MKMLICTLFLFLQSTVEVIPVLSSALLSESISELVMDHSETCVYTYILEAKDGQFTLSIMANRTITAPFNTTATAQVTLKVPSGDFQVSNLKNLVAGVQFNENGRSVAPKEAPNFDYIVFGLSSLGTKKILYTKDQKIPLFTFTNGGDCTGQPISLMDNFTDPFYPPNSQKANVSQQITVAKTGSDLSIICINNQSISDCGKALVTVQK